MRTPAHAIFPLLVVTLAACTGGVRTTTQVRTGGSLPASQPSTQAAAIGATASAASPAASPAHPTAAPSPVVSASTLPSPTPGAPATPTGNGALAMGSPFPSDPPPPPEGVTSDGGEAIVGGSLLVQVSDASGPLAGAVIEVTGPMLAASSTNDSGKARLGPLAPATGYHMRVRAPGHAMVAIDVPKVEKNTEITLTGTMGPEATISGRVVAGGAPVAGAVASDGDLATLTDANGHFTLAGLSPDAGTVHLAISKPRFGLWQHDVTVKQGDNPLADVALAPAPPTATLTFDGVPASGYAGLRAHLAADGWQLVDTPALGGVWAIVCPKQPPDDGLVAQLVDYTAHGGKVVLVGEWGGFGGYDPVAANKLAHALGLNFNPDLVRGPGDASGMLPAEVFGTGAGSIRLYAGCSVFGLPGSQTIARTPDGSYRVQAFQGTGYQTVAIARPAGTGKAIAIGDATFWSDADADGDGTSNLNTADNARFADAIFDW